MELVLNTFGVSLNRDNEAFVITIKGEKKRIPPTGIRSIQVSKGAQITSDAIMLAIEKEIEIVFMDKSGTPVGRVWSPKYGSISTIRKGQLNFTFTTDAVDWIKDVICRKIENQQALLLMLNQNDYATEQLCKKTIDKLEDYISKIKSLKGDIVNDVASQLRGWEGIASKIYFDMLNYYIPEEFRFQARSQHPAHDVVNAMLNYGYGLLYNKIEGSLIKVGIDPYVGILHRDDYSRPVLAYDVIELYRVWVDYIVYNLVAQNAITDDYYSVREDGSYWLEQLGRRVLIQAFNDYLSEIITQKGVSRSRETQLHLYTQSLAQTFKKFL